MILSAILEQPDCRVAGWSALPVTRQTSHQHFPLSTACNPSNLPRVAGMDGLFLHCIASGTGVIGPPNLASNFWRGLICKLTSALASTCGRLEPVGSREPAGRASSGSSLLIRRGMDTAKSGCTHHLAEIRDFLASGNIHGHFYLATDNIPIHCQAEHIAHLSKCKRLSL